MDKVPDYSHQQNQMTFYAEHTVPCGDGRLAITLSLHGLAHSYTEYVTLAMLMADGRSIFHQRVLHKRWRGARPGKNSIRRQIGQKGLQQRVSTSVYEKMAAVE
jgi:hypothetical protein